MSLDRLAETEIRRAAEAARAEAPPLLAIAEIEARGRTLLILGRRATAPIRFRPHVFHRRLRPEARGAALAAGLAAPRPGPGPEAPFGRRADWAAFVRAQRLDREAAFAACEWGFGRASGERARDFGFESAEALGAFACGGVRRQAALLLRRLDRDGLRDAIEANDWTRYAAASGAREPERLAARLAAAARRWREPAAGATALSGRLRRLRALGASGG